MAIGALTRLYSAVRQTDDYLPKVSALVLTALAIAGLVAALFFNMTGLAIIAAVATAAGIYNVIIAWKFSSLLSLEQETERLKTQCEGLHKAKVDFEVKASKLEQEKDELTRSIDTLKEVKDRVDGQLQEIGRLNQELNARVKEFREENDELTTTNESLQEKIGILNEKVLGLIQQIQAWKEGMKAMGGHLERFDTGLGDLRKAGEAFDGKVEELDKVLDQNIDRLGKQINIAETFASKQANSLIQQNREMQASIERLQRSLADFQQTYDDFDKEEDSMREAQGKMAKDASELHVIEQKLQATRGLLEQETNKLQAVQEALSSKMEESAQQEEKFNQLKGRLEQEVGKLEAALVKKRQERQELQLLLEKMQKKIEEMARERRASTSS